LLRDILCGLCVFYPLAIFSLIENGSFTWRRDCCNLPHYVRYDFQGAFYKVSKKTLLDYDYIRIRIAM